MAARPKVRDLGSEHWKGSEEEKDELRRIIWRQRNHKQWDKHLFSFACLLGVLTVNLLRGSRKFESTIGIQRCSQTDWLILTTFLIYCLVLSGLATRKVLREQQLKDKLGAGIAPSDIKLMPRALFKLITFAFLGGFMSGALGLGGGAIFNPMLLSMGMLPSVVSATSMYMILFSSSASSIIYIIHHLLNL